MPLIAFLERRGEWVVWGLIALYVAAYFSACVTKYRWYLYRDFDLAIFVQAVDRILAGSLFNTIRGMNWLGDHSSWILFLLAPIYAVFRSPLTLLFVQTLALGLGTLATYRMARLELASGAAAVVFAAVYLLTPAVGYTNLFEFHPEALATGLLLFAFGSLRAGRMATTLTFAGLAVLCKEDVALVVLAMSVYAMTVRQDRRGRMAAALAGLALLSLAVTFAVVRPQVDVGGAEHWKRYSQWGDTPAHVVGHVITHPIDAARALFTSPGDPQATRIKQLYYVHLLLPVVFLPLASPLALGIALPVLAEHFLSWRAQQQTIVFHYTSLIVPFVIAASVLGAKNLERWTRPPRGRRAAGAHGAGETAPRGAVAVALALAALVASLVSSVLFGPLWGTNAMLSVLPAESVRPGPYERAARAHRDRQVAQVPREGGIVAGFEFLARFAGRDRSTPCIT